MHLAPYLALLLPELGPAPPHTDPAVLVEALCQAFVAIARTMPAVLVLDDLHWADNATLELVPILASALAQERLLIVGTYRNDEIGRGHPLRRLGNELRRARVLREIVVAPLDQAATTALATHIFGQQPGPHLATTLYERTEDVPLFVTELASTLALQGQLRQSEAGIELAPGADLPIPDTLRDAVLLRLDGLPEPAQEGLALVQRGLALALAHNLASAAAEIYQRLADALEHAGDDAGARETYLTAFDFCQANAIPATAQLCVACLTVVLRQTGEWERAQTLCREVLASQHSSAHARAVASGSLGSL